MSTKCTAITSESEVKQAGSEKNIMAEEQSLFVDTKKRSMEEVSNTNKRAKTNDNQDVMVIDDPSTDVGHSGENLPSNTDASCTLSKDGALTKHGNEIVSKEVIHKEIVTKKIITEDGPAREITTKETVTKESFSSNSDSKESLARESTKREVVHKKAVPLEAGPKNIDVEGTDPKATEVDDRLGSILADEYKQFNTAHYRIYNSSDQNQVPTTNAKPKLSRIKDYTVFDNFTLVCGDAENEIALSHLPTTGVHLDDSYIGRVAIAYSNTQLNKNWPADFDTNGMPRATRAPLGEPCILRVKPGMKDVHGRVSETGGLYFGWYRGLHKLCGDQGLETFRQRPSFQTILCTGIGFRVGHEVPDDCQYNCRVLDAEKVHTNPHVRSRKVLDLAGYNA